MSLNLTGLRVTSSDINYAFVSTLNFIHHVGYHNGYQYKVNRSKWY